MIQLYCGNGKGKTTAAVGAAVRAAGSGMRVLFVQFLKDGSSSEIGALAAVSGITVLRPELSFGWYRSMTDGQKAELRGYYAELMSDIAATAARYDMIVLDETVGAYRYGLIEKEAFVAFLSASKDERELILTGRDPAPELVGLADYVTEMKKVKHPYDGGIAARRGIEF